MNKNLMKTNLKPLSHYSKNPNDDGIDLSLGEGHFNSSFNAKLKAYEALLDNNTKYSKVEGDETLRKLIIENYYPNFNYQDEIVVTNGSTQGFFSVMLTLINKGDEVIILSPHYPIYENVVRLLGGTPVIIDTRETNFKINSVILEKNITKKTKALIINEPNNPTGVTYTTQEKIELLKLFKNNKFYVIIDELYRLYTKSDYVSLSELIYDYNNKEQFIFINGLSKSHLMTGYRIGYVISNKIINEELKKINFLSVGCISSVMQQGAIGAILDEEHTKFVNNYYLNNLELLKEELMDIKVDYVNATGAYYLFINVSKFNLTGKEFCYKFKEKYHISLVPGEVFGIKYQDYVRISCCKDVKDIVKFINYLKNFYDEIISSK
ncbi:MAG: patA [Haloplasmataceae bacterium]|jgi:aspartate/methionine/tyrosine aminotransferase|nr:patA [Haloplasmataceae bacterium]